MEDDNATDVVKWLFKEGTLVDLSDELFMKHDDVLLPCTTRLKGNLLAIRTIEAPIEPILIVCEKLKVERDPENPKAFIIKYGDNHQLFLEAKDEKTKEQWMLKISMASHQMVRAELDEFSHQYLLMSSTSASNVASSNPSSYFLKDPFVKQVNFWIKSAALPTREITCTEEMYESKICMILPFEYMKLCLKWATEFCDLCKAKNWRSGTQIVTEAAANTVRHLNSHLEIYNQAIEYLDSYSGPSFRPSKDKYSLATGAVPTNLHVQIFKILDKDVVISCPFLTIGATAAIPLRFSNGGIHRQREALYNSLDKNGLDHTNIARFASRRRTLLEAKKTIGSLTRKIENEWQIGEFGSVDKTGLEILAEVRLLHETIIDMITSFPLINNLFNIVINDTTVDDDSRQTLSNQLDALEMSMISLNSKMAVIDTINDNKEGRVHFQNSARTALNSTLDILLHVVDGLINSQILGFVNGLRMPNDCQNYFHIQLREDLVMSQVITVVTTALLTSLDHLPEAVIARWDLISPMICYFSFLSCHANEKGMLEDIFDIWSTFASQIKFKFVPATSSISQVCIPQITGIRGDLVVSVPLNPAMLKKLGPNLSEGNAFRVRACFWNLGINHEATLAQSMGNVALEEDINKTALSEVQKYVKEVGEVFSDDVSYPLQQVRDELRDLIFAVDECPSRKNMSIFSKLMALMNTLNASRIIGCKSGKDRTSMAITLEEGRFVKEHCCISGDQLLQIIESLRRNGVRLENCRKNIGKSLYSFSPFQMHFLPKEFRPPTGTYGAGIMS